MLRQGLNRLVGGLQSRRTNRAQYLDRTLVLANHGEGSVQHFYHFFLGYFMPLCLWLDRTGASKISVRDCGPMNIWFDLLTEPTDLEIVPPGSALHAVIGHRTKQVILQGMDDSNKFSHKTLRAGIGSVRELLKIDPLNTAAKYTTLVVDRATSEDFHHGTESEIHMSGRERRHVPNLGEIADDPTIGEVIEVVDFARISPRQQIELTQGANVLVGQHGAGLAHMLWMPPGSRVIEIAPPLPVQVDKIFERLAAALGHRYLRLPQEGAHAPIDLGKLKELLTR